MSSSPIATAAMLAIGDELLSGRTKDKNIGQLADVLFLVGIDLKEVRIVGDDEEAIVEALNALDYADGDPGQLVTRDHVVDCLVERNVVRGTGRMHEWRRQQRDHAPQH